jgi:hypothetical protein
MRPALLPLAAATALLASNAAAQIRPATPALTCAAAADLVARSGAIVLSTGPYTYDRIVRDGGFCPLATNPKATFEATLDNPKCFVGYVCRDKFGEGNNRD